MSNMVGSQKHYLQAKETGKKKRGCILYYFIDMSPDESSGRENMS